MVAGMRHKNKDLVSDGLSCKFQFILAENRTANVVNSNLTLIINSCILHSFFLKYTCLLAITVITLHKQLSSSDIINTYRTAAQLYTSSLLKMSLVAHPYCLYRHRVVLLLYRPMYTNDG